MVKEGYKLTEIGVIPEDWEVKSYDNVFKFLPTATYSRANLSNNGEIQYLHYGDIHTKYHFILDFRKEILPKISEEQGKKYPLLKNGDVVMVDASEDYDGICKSVEVQGLDNKKAIAGLHTFLLRDTNNEFVNGFRGYLSTNPILKRQFDKLATGMKVYGVSKNNLKTVLIPIPPKPEQKAIAEALSDVDGLIASLETIIKKKEHIKTATMQQLLTGKKRLDGFSGEWVEKKLGEIGDITGAGVDKKINKNEIPIKLLNFLDVYKNDYLYSKELNHWVTTKKEKIIQCNVKKGDIFLTPSSELRKDIGISAIAMEDMKNVVYSYHLVRLRLKNIFDNFFSLFMLKTQNFLSQCEIVCEGSGKRYVISLNKFRELKVYYPKDKKEQQVIAKILSDMDKEIEALKIKLEKTKAIKRGMMQELLTGRVRLIGEEDNDYT